MREGDLVRHTALAEWGTGVVVGCDPTGYDINFEHVGRKRIVRAQAPARLAAVLRADVAADSALLVPASWKQLEMSPAKRAAARAKLRRTCEHCEKSLTASQYRDRKRLKSCPKCSAADGQQHVFLAFPDAFGPVEEAVPAADGAAAPTGAPSHCAACRAGTEPTRAQTRCDALGPAATATATAAS